MRLSAEQLITLLNQASSFRLYLDRLKALTQIATNPDPARRRAHMLQICKEACLWTPDNPSAEDLHGLYNLARAAVVAEGRAKTLALRQQFGIEIEELALSQDSGFTD